MTDQAPHIPNPSIEQTNQWSAADQFELNATAFHEAGHAVVALAMGRDIQKITIQPGRSHLGDLRLGICEIKKGRPRATKDKLEDNVLILFAGMVAESRFTGQYGEQGASRDLREISILLQARARTEHQLEKLYRRLLNKAEHLLDEKANILAVEMIANELIEKRTISGRAARHFYTQAVQQEEKKS